MIVFTNPVFLWALTAAALPLMLHMFQRRRTVVTPFPTVRFLKAAQKNSSSRVRFENFLLWLLRTLLIVALVLAFSMPVLRNATGGSSWFAHSNRDVAIVLDGSYSMNYELDRGKVWNICRETAAQVVEGLGTDDKVCVYIASEAPVPVIEKPTAEHATVLQELRSRECPGGSSDIQSAVAQAVRALEQQDKHREKEVYIFSDGQSLPWNSFAARGTDASNAVAAAESVLTKGLSREQKDSISFYVMLAGPELPDNAGITSARVSPNLLLAGQSARVAVKVMRTGPLKQVPVSLEIDGQERGRRSLDAEPSTESGLEFVIGALEPGVHVAKLSTPKDNLTIDDSFLFLLRVRKQLPALIAGSREACRYLRAALAPGADEDSVQQIDSSDLERTDLRSYQAVFLCDAFPIPGQAAIKLEEYARNGGTVVVFPGDLADEAAYRACDILPAQPNKSDAVPVELAARPLRRLPDKPGQVVTFNLAFPPGTIPMVALKRVQSFGPLAENAAVLITAGADTPFMLGRTIGRGRVFQFAVSADREWSTLPITAFFLPIVHQLIRIGAGAAIQPPCLVPGKQVPAEESIPAFRSDDAIFSPSGTALAIHDNANKTYVIDALTEAGIYTRKRANATESEPVLAVNDDRTESDLSPVSPDRLKDWLTVKKLVIARDPEEFKRLIEEFRNGRSLTELLLWASMLLSVAEWCYSNYILRKKTGATEKMRIDITGKVAGA